SAFSVYSLFFFTDTPPSSIYTLSLHDALPILTSRADRAIAVNLRDPFLCAKHALLRLVRRGGGVIINVSSHGAFQASPTGIADRSEEHTSELQSRFDLVCRLLLEKKKKKKSAF